MKNLLSYPYKGWALGKLFQSYIHGVVLLCELKACRWRQHGAISSKAWCSLIRLNHLKVDLCCLLVTLWRGALSPRWRRPRPWVCHNATLIGRDGKASVVDKNTLWKYGVGVGWVLKQECQGITLNSLLDNKTRKQLSNCNGDKKCEVIWRNFNAENVGGWKFSIDVGKRSIDVVAQRPVRLPLWPWPKAVVPTQKVLQMCLKLAKNTWCRLVFGRNSWLSNG